MRIIPVIDVMDGIVVRAIGGRRDEYRPLVSQLTDSTNPVEVAKALLDATGAAELYVADLDAIRNPTVDRRLAATLADAFPKIQLWVDPGIRTKADVANVPVWKRVSPIPIFGWRRRNNLGLVVGSETISGPETALFAGAEFAPDVVFSIDLFEGRWLGHWEPWREYGLNEHSDIIAIAEVGLHTTGGNLLILDLAQVGTGRGTGTEHWIALAKRRFDVPKVMAGGGVRDGDDVKRLEDAGADAVLVASALHEGRLKVEPG